MSNSLQTQKIFRHYFFTYNFCPFSSSSLSATPILKILFLFLVSHNSGGFLNCLLFFFLFVLLSVMNSSEGYSNVLSSRSPILFLHSWVYLWNSSAFFSSFIVFFNPRSSVLVFVYLKVANLVKPLVLFMHCFPNFIWFSVFSCSSLNFL